MMRYLLCLLILSSFAAADPLNSSLELGTSIASQANARSTFSNPAALGFQTELNDAGLLSSFTHAINTDRKNEFSAGLSYGYLGLGVEHLVPQNTNSFERFSFALGAPLVDGFYGGIRYGFTQSEAPALNDFHSVDLGVQWRAIPIMSAGIQVNHLNHDLKQYLFAIAIDPLKNVRVSFDMDTPSNDFGKTIGYSGTLTFEALRGVRLEAGYHKDFKFNAGLKLDLAATRLFSNFSPSTDRRRWTSGFESSFRLRQSILQPKTALVVKLDSSLSEEGAVGTFFSPDQPSLIEVLNTLEKAGSDPNLDVVILNIENFPLGLSAAEDLHEAILKIRNAGKRVEAFLGHASIKEYLIASAAHKITMEPAGELRFLGPRSERFYAKGTLDKIGIEAELLARGEYKSAPETFTRKDSSAANKEATHRSLKLMEKGITQLLLKSRKEAGDWTKLANEGLFGAQRALSLKVVDSIGQSKTEIEKLTKRLIVRGTLNYHREFLNLPPKIAVVVADGDILQERNGLLSVAGESQVTPDRVYRKLKRAVSDPQVKGIVLRVSSPGGEILPSHQIANYVLNFKEKKPIVVSMGDVAASGGYMISAPSNKIIANSLTVTGSIGVFLGKFNFGNLYKKIDLTKEIVSNAPYAGILSEGKLWSKAERNLMLKRLDEYYDDFVTYVSTHRKSDKTKTEKAARGRVWMGEDAKEHSLVDDLGGFRKAVSECAELSNMAFWAMGRNGYDVELIQDSPGFFTFSFGSSPLTHSLLSDYGWILQLSRSPFLYWSPVAFDG